MDAYVMIQRTVSEYVLEDNPAPPIASIHASFDECRQIIDTFIRTALEVMHDPSDQQEDFPDLPIWENKGTYIAATWIDEHIWEIWKLDISHLLIPRIR